MNSMKEWKDVAKYVEAGSLAEIQFSNDFTTITLAFIYGDGQTRQEVNIIVVCSEYAYLDLRRSEDHKADCGLILEAYLWETSDLITSFKEHKLETKAGCLYLENYLTNSTIYHLEIIGELSLNVLCSKISFELRKV